MSDTKHCPKCGCDKPIDIENWYYTRGKIRGPLCRPCERERKQCYDRERRADPLIRAKILEQNRQYQIQRMQDPAFREKERERHRECKRRLSRDPIRREMINARMRQRRRDPEFNLRRKHRYHTDAKFNLDTKVSVIIRKSLCRAGKRKTDSKSKFLDWTITELMTHLEPLFEEGMGWHNMSEWQIDHIIPLSAVNYESERDPLFKMVWSLSNLAPLWAKDNNEKLGSLEWQLPDTYKNPKLRALYEDRDYLMTIF